MVVRWCAAGMLEAKKQFRRVNGYLHLPALRAALTATSAPPCATKETRRDNRPSPKFHELRDIL